ncbi:MAG TPA: peptidylprolyl isomerase, partial [Caulobacteraceae bacterium]|nr:peptidylprolyl isomerase [Caulobacteraceae bacterium]
APAGPSGPTDADWRTPDPENVLVSDTSKGRIVVELAPAAAPQAAAQVRALARAGFYNGRAFFRVLDGFMDQTGDPKDDGTGQSDKPNLPPEFTFRRGADTPIVVVDKSGGSEWGYLGSLPVVSQTMDLALLMADHKVSAYGAYCPGVLGMARSDDPGSGNSQFFLMRGTTASLNQNYTAFGATIAGLDVIRAIKTGAPGSGHVDDPQDKMLTVRVLADIPEAERPKVRVLDPRGPWFKVLVERARKEKLVGFSVCDIDLPGEAK